MPSTIPMNSSTPIDASSTPSPRGAPAILSHSPSKRRDKANANRQPHGATKREIRHPHGAGFSPGSWVQSASGVT
jgi:hypothetical protein